MGNQTFLFVSHCLLNQLVRAGSSFTPGATSRLLNLLSGYPIHVYQLPCPEYLFMGRRSKKPQDVWETRAGFKTFLSQVASEVKEKTQQIRENRDVLVVAIARSPCCSASEVYRAGKLVKGRGLWISELEKKFKCHITEFDFKRVDDSLRKTKEFLDERVVDLGSHGKTEAVTREPGSLPF